MTPEQRATVIEAMAQAIFRIESGWRGHWLEVSAALRDEHRKYAVGALDAALVAMEAAGIVTVPVEPNEAMLAAIDTPERRLPLVADEIWDLYRAMLDARPR